MKLRNARRLKARRYLYREYSADRGWPDHRISMAASDRAEGIRRDPRLDHVRRTLIKILDAEMTAPF